MVLLLAGGGPVWVPIGGEASVRVRGAMEARVVNPSVAEVVRITKEAVLVRGKRAGETSLILLAPEGYKEVALKVGDFRGEAGDRPVGAQLEEELEPLPLTVFLGQPGVTLVAKSEGTSPPALEGEAPPLEVWIEADKPSALVDEKISLTVTVKARKELKGVEVRLPMPEGVGYLLGSGGKEAFFDLKGRSVVWRLGRLRAGESRLLPCEVRVLKEVSALSFVAEARAEGVEPVRSREARVKVGRLVLAAVYALPDTFVVRRNIFSSLRDVKGEANRRIVLRLEGLGIIEGYPDRTFKPERHATRAEATKVVFLASALEGLSDHTTIFFVLTSPAKVTVNIRDKTGRVVRTLLSGRPFDAGQHTVNWDGRDSQGVFVAPGIYTYEVSARTDEGKQVKLSGRLSLVEARALRPRGRPSFKDVPAKEWYAGYIAEAERRGLVKGYPDGTFKPSLPINRAEFATLVVRAAGLEREAERRKDQALGIVDEDMVPAWARGYIAMALSRKLRAKGRPIIGLKDGAFEPLHFVKRMEMASAIHRFIDRDTGREVSVSGAVSPGARVSINGRRVPIGSDGAFKCRLPLKPGVNVITVIVK